MRTALSNKTCLVLVIALGASAAPAAADTVNINAAERGWVIPFGNNGSSPTNDYFAGSDGVLPFANWFEFSIPVLTGGPLTSATLQLQESSDFGHLGGTLTYAVYGLSAQPMLLSDVTTTDPFGATNTSVASEGTLVSIPLNAAALAAIQANQGSDLFIGGIDSGQDSSGGAFDFDASTGGQTLLSVTTGVAIVPEPSTAPVVGMALVAILTAAWWKRSRAQG